MIRQETDNGWILIGHQDHARLAGAFAKAWGNSDFPKPEPFGSVLVAVTRHDDSWAPRDARPLITPEGRPSAFSTELVGTYDAFEEIDLENYLQVRGQATEAVAEDDPYAAILVSMHTVNLLTEQADLTGLSGHDQKIHSDFIEGQHNRQKALLERVKMEGMDPAFLVKSNLRRGFEFLQACDSLSLFLCVNYPKPLPLRHTHPLQSGEPVEIVCRPRAKRTFEINPWPFDKAEDKHFEVPCLRIEGKQFIDQNAFDEACQNGQKERLLFTLSN